MTATEIFAAQCQTVSYTAASISKATVTVQSDSFGSIMKQRFDTDRKISDQSKEKLNSNISDGISGKSDASDAAECKKTQGTAKAERSTGREDITTDGLRDDAADATNEIQNAATEDQVQNTLPENLQEENNLAEETDVIMNIAKNLFKVQNLLLSKDGESAEGMGLSKEQYEEISELLASAMMQFAQLFNVDIEDVQVSFEKLEITTSNMFEVQSMRDLMMDMSNISDPMEIVNDPQLFDTFTSLREIMENIKQQAEEMLQSFDDSMVQNVFDSFDINEIFESMKASLKTISSIEENITADEGTNVLTVSEQLQDKAVSVEDNQTAETVTNEATEGIEDINPNPKTQKEETEDSSKKGSEESEAGIKDRKETVTTKNGVRYSTEEFVAGLEKAAEKLELNDTIPNTQYSVRDVVYQLVDAIKVNITPEKSSLELNLTPDSLGKVNINISSKGGVMTAQITTDNQAAKEAIESQMQILKETIEAKGITIEAIEVTVSSFSFMDSKNAQSEQEQLNNSGSKKRSSAVDTGAIESGEVPADTETREKQIMSQNGSTVSYVA